MHFENSLAFAQQLDAKDPLRAFRQEFHFPKHGDGEALYFTGNSLGLLPKRTASAVSAELNKWRDFGVEGFFRTDDPWLDFAESCASALAAIVGAKPSEVVAMNSLTVNLHLLLATFYRPTKDRYKIICEAKAFPSDQYAFETAVRHHGFDPAECIVEVGPVDGAALIEESDIIDAIEEHGSSVALVLFGGVHYYTGQAMPIAAITEAAQRVGAYAGFDLAHAAGNIELHMHDWNIDFAVWCSYKYLNSGPGGVGGAYIHERHAQAPALPRLAGWWGYDKSTRFNMAKGFVADAGANGWQLSTPNMISLAVHRAALEIFEEAGMERLIAKSRLLSDYLIFVLDGLSEAHPDLIEVITPRSPEKRGAQVSFSIAAGGKAVFQKLTENGAIVDWREPSVIRVTAVPLYNSFADVQRFGTLLDSILDERTG